MFTRDSTTGHAPLEPVAGARPARPPSAHVQSAEAGKSVISNDLRIIGQSLKIISRSTLPTSCLVAVQLRSVSWGDLDFLVFA